MDEKGDNLKKKYSEMLKKKYNEIFNNLNEFSSEQLIEELTNLYNAGLPIDTRLADGNTALHRALSNHKSIIAKFLIKKGIDVNADGMWPHPSLHKALYDTEVLELMLQNGADVDKVGIENDKTALHIAAEKGNNDAVKLLLKYGANINKKVGKLNYISKNPLPRETALDLAIENGRADVVRTLIQSGARIRQNHLHYAVCYKDLKTVFTLLQHGLNVNSVDSNNNTPLHIAIYKECSPKLVLMLVYHGANVNAVNYEGDTPLHIAIKKDLYFGYNPEIIKLLVQNNADYTIKNDDGKTPVDIALNKKYAKDDITKAIQEKTKN